MLCLSVLEFSITHVQAHISLCVCVCFSLILLLCKWDEIFVTLFNKKWSRVNVFYSCPIHFIASLKCLKKKLQHIMQLFFCNFQEVVQQLIVVLFSKERPVRRKTLPCLLSQGARNKIPQKQSQSQILKLKSASFFANLKSLLQQIATLCET